MEILGAVIANIISAVILWGSKKVVKNIKDMDAYKKNLLLITVAFYGSLFSMILCFGFAAVLKDNTFSFSFFIIAASINCFNVSHIFAIVIDTFKNNNNYLSDYRTDKNLKK